jgi:hypothetical protein
MSLDVRRAVNLDQALHGARLIRIEFLLAVLLFGALAGLNGLWLLGHYGQDWPAIVIGTVLLVFFLGGLANYLALLLLARGPSVAATAADRSQLRNMTWQMLGLTLLPGAAALTAWRQRPTNPRPSINSGDSAS